MLLLFEYRLQKAPSGIFYNISKFKQALVGTTEIRTSEESPSQINSKELYTFSKVESGVDSQTGKETTLIYLSILQESTLMSLRHSVYVSMPIEFDSFVALESMQETSTKDILESDGLITGVSEATAPMVYSEVKFMAQVSSNGDSRLISLKLSSPKFSAVAHLKIVDNYAGIYLLYLSLFGFCAWLQFTGMRRVMKNCEDAAYFRRLSMAGLLLDTCVTSGIMYHFGVLLPVDMALVVPQIALMVLMMFVWMRKMVHVMQQANRNDSIMKAMQFLCTLVMLVGGLYLPSLDRMSHSLLIAVVLPLVLQIANSFNNRVSSFSREYNMYLKLPQAVTIGYIYGCPGTCAHLLPTYPLKSALMFCTVALLTGLSYLQQQYHPRLHIRTWSDYKRALRMPKRIWLAVDEEKPARPECAICLNEFDEGAEAVETQCRHLFHEECLNHWLEKQERCPLCREAVFKREDDLLNSLQ